MVAGAALCACATRTSQAVVKEEPTLKSVLEAVLISFDKFVKHDLDECDLYHGFRSFSEEFIIDG